VTREQFKSARDTLGLTQTAMAQRLGVHWMTVSKWERGLVAIPNPVEQLIGLWVKAGKPRRKR
jgi:DNA-binding transcriptional regulator YiaG